MVETLTQCSKSDREEKCIKGCFDDSSVGRRVKGHCHCD